MSMLPPLSPFDIGQLDQLTITPRMIKGTPVVVDFMMSEDKALALNLSDAEIKLKLCNEIATELYKQKLIEFTREQSHITGDIRYRARIFAVPNTDVQLLREQGILK